MYLYIWLLKTSRIKLIPILFQLVKKLFSIPTTLKTGFIAFWLVSKMVLFILIYICKVYIKSSFDINRIQLSRFTYISISKYILFQIKLLN